ncbi:MAG: hypothetical protein K0R28_6772, partial [Paenibacillus sp.]|nr:hypothetical protein [Paenibacillus sp.]
MQKYKQVFIRQFDQTLEKWQTSGKDVPESELYRLLHSIKGTAATIGLQEWTDQAAALLQDIDEESATGLSYPDIILVLAPLIGLRTQAGASGAAQTEAVPAEEPDAKRNNPDAPTAIAPAAPSAAAPAKALVLLVDDDLALLQLFKERLEAEGCLVLATPYPDKAIQWFYELKPDCVVLDVVLPGHSGYDLLSILQDRSLQLIVPVILMSAQHDKDARLKAYTRGADDFLAKPVDPDEFAVRVMNKIRRKQSIGKYMLSDECTGLYNAVYLRAEWGRYSREYARSGVSLYAALLDIDRFQELNDKFGHSGADSLLVQ